VHWGITHLPRRPACTCSWLRLGLHLVAFTQTQVCRGESLALHIRGKKRYLPNKLERPIDQPKERAGDWRQPTSLQRSSWGTDRWRAGFFFCAGAACRAGVLARTAGHEVRDK
jgi:hypothetical protein